MRSMSSGLAWQSTCTVTPSGTMPLSMIRRMKSKSGWDAAGKPTSISTNPTSNSSSYMRSFSSTFMGSISAWLPSLKSTLHQRGGSVSTALGQWRSGRSTGSKAWYFWNGMAPLRLPEVIDRCCVFIAQTPFTVFGFLTVGDVALSMR